MPDYRFKTIKPRMSNMDASRVPMINLDEEDRYDPDVIERKALYRSDRWREFRKTMLKTRECRKCFFCGAWATTLEHLVGHGEDAQEVARALGLPPVDPDWRERFWTGPFSGTCDFHAKSRSGAETAGRLLRWTENWLAKKREQGR